MAHFVQLVAVLTVFLVAVVVQSEGVKVVPLQEKSDVCETYSTDGYLGMQEVFDMIELAYEDQFQSMETEMLEELIQSTDEDHDGRLNMRECGNFVKLLTEDRA